MKRDTFSSFVPPKVGVTIEKATINLHDKLLVGTDLTKLNVQTGFV